MATGQTSAGGGRGEFVNGSLDGRTSAFYEGENGCVRYQGDGVTTPTVKVRKGSLFYTSEPYHEQISRFFATAYTYIPA